MNPHLIVLPEEAEAHVEEQIAAGRAVSVNDFMVDLVNRDKAHREQAIADLRSLIADAEASGISELSVEEIFDQLDAEYGVRD